MKQVNPYLTFNGNCEEAFNFYKAVFGGEFACVKRFSEAPPIDGFDFTEEQLNRVMNIALSINETCALIGSDAHPAMGEVAFGKNVSLSLNVTSKEQADEVFNSLSVGGMVFMPMTDMFWGSYFGMCEDRFGLNWMVNYDTTKKLIL